MSIFEDRTIKGESSFDLQTEELMLENQYKELDKLTREEKLKLAEDLLQLEAELHVELVKERMKPHTTIDELIMKADKTLEQVKQGNHIENPDIPSVNDLDSLAVFNK